MSALTPLIKSLVKQATENQLNNSSTNVSNLLMQAKKVLRGETFKNSKKFTIKKEH